MMVAEVLQGNPVGGDLGRPSRAVRVPHPGGGDLGRPFRAVRFLSLGGQTEVCPYGSLLWDVGEPGAVRRGNPEGEVRMKKLFLIGGMGAGKSTARKALTDEGLAWIDLDQVGHEVLMWDTVKDDLRGAFGDDIFDENGEVVRSALAAKAFATPAATRKLNTITMPRIEERYTDLIDGFEAEGKPAVVVEYSVFRNRQSSLAYGADVVMAVLAPLEVRIERAVKSGFSEEDVRARIARQITDADRIEASDVVFNNDGTPDELRNEVISWWSGYKKTI